MDKIRVHSIIELNENTSTCKICLDDNITSYTCSICNYNMCQQCSDKYFKQYKNKKCPHCRNNIQIEVIVNSNNNYLGIIDNRSQIYSIVKKYKKTLTILLILQFNVPAYYLGNSTQVCTVKDSISNYIINVLLGYSIIASVCSCIWFFIVSFN